MKISTARYTVYWRDVTSLLAPDALRAAAESVSTERRAQALRYRNPRRAAQSVLCELLLREALADMGLDAEPVFAFGEYGKPYLTAPEGIAFSFAHSGETAVCAVTRETAIGVDAERVRPVNPRVALRCFTEREREALAGGGAGVFFRLWTQKESFLKAVGGGVSMRAFEVEAEGGAVRQDFAPGNYETHVHSLGGDCPLAVCLRAAT